MSNADGYKKRRTHRSDPKEITASLVELSMLVVAMKNFLEMIDTGQSAMNDLVAGS